MSGKSTLVTETYTDSEDEGDIEVQRGPSNESSRETPSSRLIFSTPPSKRLLLPLVAYVDDDDARKVEGLDQVESQDTNHVDHGPNLSSPTKKFTTLITSEMFTNAGIENVTNVGYLDSAAEASDSESLNSDFILMKLLTATHNRPTRPHPDPSLDDTADGDAQPVIQCQNLVVSGDMQMPPEPPGLCSATLQESISRLWERKKVDKNFDLNLIIQNKKAFRNPSIYEKLIEVLSSMYMLLYFDVPQNHAVVRSQMRAFISVGLEILQCVNGKDICSNQSAFCV